MEGDEYPAKFGKLIKVDEKGQNAPTEITQVASIKYKAIFIFANGRDKWKDEVTKIASTKWRLRTGTGESARIHREAEINIY